MSKSTKIIAALGVVAGLGCAVMPFGGAFAVDSGSDAYPKAANAEVKVTIAEGIAMSIEGSNDSGTTWNTAVLGAAINDTNTNPADATAADVADNTLVAGAKSEGKMQHRLTVSTSANSGYNLKVNAATPNLRADADTDGAHDIVASTAANGKDGSFWYYKIGEADTKIAMTAEKALVASNTTSVADAQSIVKYFVELGADQASGTYATDVTYTATINE